MPPMRAQTQKEIFFHSFLSSLFGVVKWFRVYFSSFFTSPNWRSCISTRFSFATQNTIGSRSKMRDRSAINYIQENFYFISLPQKHKYQIYGTLARFISVLFHNKYSMTQFLPPSVHLRTTTDDDYSNYIKLFSELRFREWQDDVRISSVCKQ